MTLAGIKGVSVYDPTVIQIEDLGANFFLRESDVGKKTRAEVSVQSLKELNPFVEVDSLEKIDPEMAKDYTIIIVTELLLPLEVIFKFNEVARKNGKGFIFTLALGLFGMAFTDFGDNHIVKDRNGNPTIINYISGITKGNPTTIYFEENVESF